MPEFPSQSIWITEDHRLQIIDQRFLPHKVVVEDLKSSLDVETAIKDMHVRGAPLIGVCAAYGAYLASLEVDDNDEYRENIVALISKIEAARPTAKNLFWALEKQKNALFASQTLSEYREQSRNIADSILEHEISACRAIGEKGIGLVRDISRKKGGAPVNILTHCNAGWLACVKYGTATAPIYLAHDEGIEVHVWVDETRPRNQGARLTAWELGCYGVDYTVIADNTGGHLMQKGLVDMVIVGTDRTTRCGDVANKIGTYLKALAAYDNHVPFYVALPSSTFDWEIESGEDIPIEERSFDEVKMVRGLYDGDVVDVLVTPAEAKAKNFAFDVTPARLVTGFITEYGIFSPAELNSLKALL